MDKNSHSESPGYDVAAAAGRDKGGRWLKGHSPRSGRSKSISDHIRELLEMPIEKVREIALVLERMKADKSSGSICAGRFIAANAILNSCEQPTFLKEMLDRTEGKVVENINVNRREISFTFVLSRPQENLSDPVANVLPNPVLLKPPDPRPPQLRKVTGITPESLVSPDKDKSNR